MISRLRGMRWLPKTLSLVFLMLLTCFVAVACSSSSTSDSGFPAELTFATEDDYPPFDFQQDGKHVGYNQDMLDLVAANAPFTIKQEIIPWQGVLAGIASGKYAASNAVASVLEERLDAVNFTMPTTELTNYFLKRKGDDSIKAIADFAGKNIGVQQGGATAVMVDEIIRPELAKTGQDVGNVAEYGAFAEAYQDLENKRIDIVINNVVALSQLVKEKGDIYEIGTQIGPTIYAGWTVSKNNPQLLEFLNTELGKLKASGKMKELQEKWLGIAFDLPDEPQLPGGVPIPAS
ncbi:MAG: transporter substrate-binding domain-containing protein [Oculatellaceae cyanobacterium bins.114]|nr:transporter substrate-binding domain-containing protein [Oculatellaceae cyanobacterium bins.114]